MTNANNTLSPTDLALIQDEALRYQKTHEHVALASQQKTRELADNEAHARDLTAQIVNTQRDEEKQALQNDESVAHGLTKLRLSQTHSLSQLSEQPYFARVIYHEKNRDVEFKLGMASFPEERIIDWRKAPVSRLYYDYEEGDEYDDEIAGVERQGNIQLKRAYQGKRAELHNIELKDASYVLSRGTWHKQKKQKQVIFSLKDRDQIRELLKSHDAKAYETIEQESSYMQHILSLLTPEQFELISSDTVKPVIIQGSAGTGKTTVALHRLAWLLFSENSKARPEHCLILMFNKTLAEYVKNVLPSMSVHKVKIATFYDWARDVIRTSLGHDIHIEYARTSEAAAHFKSSAGILENLSQFLVHTENPGPADTALFAFYASPFCAAPPAALAYLKKQCEHLYFDEYDFALLLTLIFHQKSSYSARFHPTNLDYLVIDEAQDFTVPELTAIVNALEDKKQICLAGDLAQKIFDHRDFGTWHELLDKIGLKGVDVLDLNIAFRSTYQIYELAEFIRNPNINTQDVKITAKFGPDPRITICSSLTDAITHTEKWIESIITVNRQTTGAVICKTATEARDLHSALVKLGTHGIRLGDAHHFEFTPGIVITEVRQVKGLEFKNVLIFNPSRHHYHPGNKHDRNLLYVAITRAEYRLDCVLYDSPSPLLPDYLHTIDLSQVVEDKEDNPLFSDIDQDLSAFEKKDDE
jgi:DNA helicase IV